MTARVKVVCSICKQPSALTPSPDTYQPTRGEA
jgi:hypothetical protein